MFPCQRRGGGTDFVCLHVKCHMPSKMWFLSNNRIDRCDWNLNTQTHFVVFVALFMTIDTVSIKKIIIDFIEPISVEFFMCVSHQQNYKWKKNHIFNNQTHLFHGGFSQCDILASDDEEEEKNNTERRRRRWRWRQRSEQKCQKYFTVAKRNGLCRSTHMKVVLISFSISQYVCNCDGGKENQPSKRQWKSFGFEWEYARNEICGNQCAAQNCCKCF